MHAGAVVVGAKPDEAIEGVWLRVFRHTCTADAAATKASNAAHAAALGAVVEDTDFGAGGEGHLDEELLDEELLDEELESPRLRR